MDFVSVLGIVGSIASLVGLFLPAQSKRQRIIHVIYGVSLVVLAGIAVHYQQKLSRMSAIEVAAGRLIHDRRMDFTDEGFIQAALAFMEQNKDIYPDSYARAQEICKQHECLVNPYNGDGSQATVHADGIINASSALAGLLKGIAEINRSQ